MSQPITKQQHVAVLREALDELHQHQTRPMNQKTNPFENVKSLFESIPPEIQASVLDKAIGMGIRRFRAAASILEACEPSDCVDNWIMAGLTHSERDRRDWMIQTVGNRKLQRFAECIAHIIDTDEESRWWAVIAAGNLGTGECLRSLVALADSFGNQPIPMALIQALAKYDSPVVARHLQRVFSSHTDERDRVFAAWGLARQNHQEAINYLVNKLDEPDASSESRRAAQALSDVYGWDLEWIPEAPQQAKKLWESQIKRQNGA